MIRTLMFAVITFVLAYLLYVLPFFLGYALFTGSSLFNVAALPLTLVAFALLWLYLATTFTNKLLKSVVYYGMGIGFLALMILPLMLLTKVALGLDGAVIGWLSIIILVGLVVICIFNANALTVKNLNVRSDKVFDARRFAFISDVHIGSNHPNHLRRICARLAELEFEALLIGGDLFDSSDFRVEDIAALGGLDADIFFITGNHEGYVKDFSEQLARFNELNIKVLDNESANIDGINLIGISDQSSMAARSEAIDRLYRPDSFNLALVHQPSIWDKTRNRVELMLCGHTHNGQIFPFNLLVRLQFRYVYGLFSHESSHLYVSSGTGCWGPRFRLGSKNEILLVELLPS